MYNSAQSALPARNGHRNRLKLGNIRHTLSYLLLREAQPNSLFLFLLKKFSFTTDYNVVTWFSRFYNSLLAWILPTFITTTHCYNYLYSINDIYWIALYVLIVSLRNYWVTTSVRGVFPGPTPRIPVCKLVSSTYQPMHLCHHPRSHHPSFLHSFTPGSKPQLNSTLLMIIAAWRLD